MIKIRHQGYSGAQSLWTVPCIKKKADWALNYITEDLVCLSPVALLPYHVCTPLNGDS